MASYELLARVIARRAPAQADTGRFRRSTKSPPAMRLVPRHSRVKLRDTFGSRPAQGEINLPLLIAMSIGFFIQAADGGETPVNEPGDAAVCSSAVLRAFPLTLPSNDHLQAHYRSRDRNNGRRMCAQRTSASARSVSY